MKLVLYIFKERSACFNTNCFIMINVVMETSISWQITNQKARILISFFILLHLSFAWHFWSFFGVSTSVCLAED